VNAADNDVDERQTTCLDVGGTDGVRASDDAAANTQRQTVSRHGVHQATCRVVETACAITPGLCDVVYTSIGIPGAVCRMTVVRVILLVL